MGAGNAGRAYISAALNTGYRVEFVDENPDRLDQALREFGPQVNGKTSLSQVSEVTTAIVATHANSHHSILRELVDRGATSLLVEKVLSNSARGLEEIELIAARTDILVGTHNRWSIVGVPELLRREFDVLGPLTSIDSVAGRFCISAGGIHTLALAARVFPALHESIHVSARLNLETDSPRGNGLRVVTGFLIVESCGVPLVSLSSHASSKVGPTLLFTFESGQVLMDLDGSLKVRPVSPTSGVLRDYLPWDMNAKRDSTIDTSRIFERAIEYLSDADATAKDLAAGVRANEILLAGLTSSSQGGKQVAVDRGSDWWIMNREMDICWPIT